MLCTQCNSEIPSHATHCPRCGWCLAAGAPTAEAWTRRLIGFGIVMGGTALVLGSIALLGGFLTGSPVLYGVGLGFIVLGALSILFQWLRKRHLPRP